MRIWFWYHVLFQISENLAFHSGTDISALLRKNRKQESVNIDYISLSENKPGINEKLY
jgi:hypothetical protein